VRADPRRDTPLIEQLEIADEIDEAEVFVKLVNEGNIIDIMVNLAIYREGDDPAFERLADMATAVMAAVGDDDFHTIRAAIL
jgi:hypothetical protein